MSREYLKEVTFLKTQDKNKQMQSEESNRSLTKALKYIIFNVN